MFSWYSFQIIIIIIIIIIIKEKMMNCVMACCWRNLEQSGICLVLL